VLAIWLIVSNNSPQGAAFFNSSSAVIGSVLKTQSDVVDFFSLAEENEVLLAENARLTEELKAIRLTPDSVKIELDSALNATFKFKGARVVSNSLRFSQNHLTINKGEKDGVKPGMGVFNQEGVVGRVKSVSTNFAVVISLLNTGSLISSKIKSNGEFGTINWDGKNSRQAKMLYVPRHVKAQAGDTVITSGFNAVFPEGILIGTISSIDQTGDPNYLDILIDLSTDFSTVKYVYLVENTEISERDSLNQQSKIQDEF
jgi:rod shape-determining protein MreC